MAKKEVTNCLRNEKVTVRLIKKKRGFIDDPRSPLYGGLAETSQIVFTVPRLRSGVLKNVLTDSEKECIEKLLGLEENALSVHKQKNNYWVTGTPGCINTVVLTKRDTILDLNNVNDYIKYKILLANSDQICPSLEEYENAPKATYMFVMINDTQEAKSVGAKANIKFDCYTGYGKYKDDANILRCVIELMEGKKVAANTKIEHLQSMVTKFIDEDPKRFREVINDPLLEYKSLIKQGIEKGIIASRNNLLYLRENSMPLCNEYEEPRLSVAAKYLADPANQDLRDSIIAQMK